MSDLIRSYMDFLDKGKTERRCVDEIIDIVRKEGYVNLLETTGLKAGDKVYYQKMNKTVILFNIGTGDISKGMNILGAHIDSPRLDIKANPVYESSDIVYLNTHYYGGIKKYQWVATPLALYGVVFLSDGTKIDVAIGDEADDPVFCISDILPHMAQRQMEAKASEFIEGEKLDLILGCAHKTEDEAKESDVNKKKILEILKSKYGFEEDDFNSAELEAVPAGKARYLGLDKSLVLAYGQDDRVCSYTSLRAMLEVPAAERTTCCILTDKEEIGSNGATGMESRILDNAVAELVERLDASYAHHEIVVRRALENSFMLSSDVNSAYDPLNGELYDKQNSSYLSRGVVFNKYTGSRGKSGANDANAEFIAKIRGKLEQNNVRYQIAEMSKVDVGGGGTIAKYCARYGMNVIDCGVAILSMHALWEIASTYDIESAYNCYKAFLTL